MKILVTGSAGQLGRELHNIAESGEAYGFSWLFTDVAELDITSSAAVGEMFAQECPDAVVNCAAWTDVDGAEKDPAGAFRINEEGPRVLAIAAKQSGAAFIHISTDFVFDGCERTPYTESDIPHPLSVYGESKLVGEKAVVESGCAGAVVRTSWLYSPYGRNFVKAILGAASKNREIRVVSDQWGNPTAADGLAAAIVQMIPQLVSKPRRAERYHYCDAGVVSRSGFAEEIIRQAELDCKVVPVLSSEYPMTAERPAYSALDTAKIGRDFDIVPRPWQEALAGVLRRMEND